ncbi:MAG: capsule assembly Wzi family protein [Imperialibacter sp.]|uniref:capsule assembly Wzi family protein n=1 Tax=Imperialibacter sp. TaxID=2038411 RepID=UPI0032ECCE2F
MRKYLFWLLSLCLFNQVFGQSIPVVGYGAVEDYLRRGQLLGEISDKYSFSRRSLSFINDDSSYINDVRYLWEGNSVFDQEKFKVAVLPLQNRFQSNTKIPYGGNDGAIIPAVGAQNLLSFGLHIKYGRLTTQLRPEYIFARDLDYDGFPSVHYDIIWMWRYIWWNRIDQPEKLTNGKYNKILPGQSLVKYSFDHFSVGISTQNLWWGPGHRNAIILSNNAQGFPHLFLETNAPVVTAIGNFEGQFIAGKIENSGKPLPQQARTYYGATLFSPKRNKWRYISGINFSWQPKWVKGLFLGYNKTKQLYHDDLAHFQDFIPVFNRKENPFEAPIIGQSNSSQQSSVFLRWVFQPESAEIYAEYGNHGKPRKFRRWLEEPEKNRGYTLGLTKLFPLRNKQYLQFQIEVTQLQQSQREGIFDADSWYSDDYIRQGFTNKGQLLGAGIGPGGNSQYLDFSWIRGINRIGIQLERITHDNDWMLYAFSRTGDYRRHWIDFTAGLHIDWKISNILLSAKAVYVRSINYQWELVFDPDLPWFRNGRDVTNFHPAISCTIPLQWNKNYFSFLPGPRRAK